MDNGLIEKEFILPLMKSTLSIEKQENRINLWGVASTEDPDLVGDVAFIDGMDTSYLKKYGYFDWNHFGETDPNAILGEIDTVKKSATKLEVGGFLYGSRPMVKSVVQLYDDMVKSASDRKIGMSVYGKVLTRENNKILKSWVKSVAITYEPVNRNTWIEFKKSVGGAFNFCSCPEGDCKNCKTCGKHKTEMEKVMTAGTDVAPTSGGGVMRVQDLEHDKKKAKKHAVHKLMKELSVGERTAETIYNIGMI